MGWKYDRQHLRECMRKKIFGNLESAKNHAARVGYADLLKRYFDIIKEGITKMRTPKWYQTLCSIDENAKIWSDWSTIRFWQWVTRTLDTILHNYSAAIKMHKLMGINPTYTDKGSAYRFVWSTSQFLVFTMLFDDFGHSVFDRLNRFNQGKQCISPGDYYYNDTTEAVHIEEAIAKLDEYAKLIYAHSDDMFLDEYDLNEKLQAINKNNSIKLPHFDNNIKDLLQGKYTDIHLKKKKKGKRC